MINAIKILPTIADLKKFTGDYPVVMVVKDGLFKRYTGTEAADGGIIISDAALPPKRWKRDFESTYIRPEWYGADPVTGKWDYAVTACINYINNHPETKEIKFYAKQYFFESSIVITKPIRLTGESLISEASTVFRFPENVQCIRFTEDDSLDYNVEMSNISFQQNIPAIRNPDAHAIVLRCKAKFDNVSVFYASGNGLDIQTDDDAHVTTNPGSTAGSIFTGCRFTDCLNGVFITGREASTMLFTKLFVVNPQRWGVFDNGFLGNNYVSPQIDFTGGTNSGGRTVVSYAGKYYGAINSPWIPNINHQPDISPAYWQVVEQMGSTVWNTTIEYFGGGVLVVANANAWTTITAPYMEAYQPGIRLNSRSICIGGTRGTNVYAGADIRVLFGTQYNSANQVAPNLLVGRNTGTLESAQAPLHAVHDITQGDSNAAIFEGLNDAMWLNLRNKISQDGFINYSRDMLRFFSGGKSMLELTPGGTVSLFTVLDREPNQNDLRTGYSGVFKINDKTFLCANVGGTILKTQLQ